MLDHHRQPDAGAGDAAATTTNRNHLTKTRGGEFTLASLFAGMKVVGV